MTFGSVNEELKDKMMQLVLTSGNSGTSFPQRKMTNLKAVYSSTPVT